MSAALAEAPKYQREIHGEPIKKERIRRPEYLRVVPKVACVETAIPTRRRRINPEVIPDAVMHIDPSAVAAISPVREVLANLQRVGVDASQPHAGYALVDTVKNNSHIKKIAVMGLPGTGKSTFIEQFIEELFTQTEGAIGIKITSFDPAFQRMVKQLPRQFWEKVHWEFINDSLLLTSKETKRKQKGKRKIGPGRIVEIIEVPFVGSKKTSDRGRSFIEKSWQKVCDNEESDSMIFVPFAPLPQNVNRTASFREEIAEAKHMREYVEIFLRYGIDVVRQAVERGMKDIASLVQGLVKQIRSSATKTQVQAVMEDAKRAIKEELPHLTYDQLAAFISLPPDVRLSHDEKYRLRQHIFYWEKTLDEMGISSEQRFIMLNPPLPRIHRTHLQKAA